MFSTDAVLPNSQNNAKLSLQALLKTREQLFNSRDDVPQSDAPPPYLDQEHPHPDSLAQNLSDDSYLESLEFRKDFHYSQKLFHIADGNLYSIFSPLQGRSYGMKPSFLRKHKYTIQECHNRGRKNLRKGLKFHNFLPSESVTSEKNNDYFQSKWKVHSECRLREEHGTKQITISNWSKNIQNPVEEHSNPDSSFMRYPASVASTSTKSSYGGTSTQSSFSIKNEAKDKNEKLPTEDIDPYNFDLSLQNSSSSESSSFSMSHNGFSSTAKKRISSECDNSKKDALDSVLNNLMLKSTRNFSPGDDLGLKPSTHDQKHRRKPIHTRRIVPYVKYLSLLKDNDDGPLDLSSKCTPEKQNLCFETESNSSTPCSTHSDGKSDVMSNFSELSLGNQSSNLTNNFPNITHNSTLPPQVSAPLTFFCPLPVNKNISSNSKDFLSPGAFLSAHPNSNFNKQDIFANPTPHSSSNIAHHAMPNSLHFSLQKSSIKETPTRRKRSQRSVIKQKLEDTFRQNGFLVKTKQVSDGEATFCKFRQLRKYTRYYLKSWQQHLPDEVHKMWKGFLPPKTVLPPIMNPNENQGS